MVVQTDGAGQRYVDIGGSRVTLVPNGHTGGKCIRVQAYTGNGDSLHRGAEIPARNLYALIQACTVLETVETLAAARATASSFEWDDVDFDLTSDSGRG